jgi:MFS transporter, PAT family, beta-lactamase induction signal transducer AmpG
MTSGVVTAVSLFILRNAGLPIDQAASISSFAVLPLTFYFFYAPLADFFFRRRTWWLIATSTGGLLCATAVLLSSPSRAHLIAILLFTGSVSAGLMTAAIGGLAATLLTKAEKAHVGAWSNAGSLGANSLLFGVLVFLAPRCSNHTLALLTAAAMLLPGLAAFALPEPSYTPSTGTLAATLGNVAREVGQTLFSWTNLPGILLLLAPIGVGSITSMLTGLSAEYHASAAQVAFANGWGGGLITAAGALCVLLVPARWNRLPAYCLAAVVYGIVSLLIGAGPMKASTLVAGLLASNFAQGICWGAYTGVILQTMGRDGRCHSSRCAVLNSLGNFSAVYLLWAEGKVAAHFGAHAVGYFDGAANLATAAAFFLWWVFIAKGEHASNELEPLAVLEPSPVAPGYPA